MKKRIKLNSVEDVKEFVNITRHCEFDIDVQYRHIMLDGKSLLGLMSMDLRLELIVYYREHSEVLEQMLKKFEVKEKKKEYFAPIEG